MMMILNHQRYPSQNALISRHCSENRQCATARCSTDKTAENAASAQKSRILKPNKADRANQQDQEIFIGEPLDAPAFIAEKNCRNVAIEQPRKRGPK